MGPAAEKLPSSAPQAPPEPAGVTQTVTAQVHLQPELQAMASEHPVGAGTFADADHGWMIADYTRLLATTDAAYFLDPQAGWLLCGFFQGSGGSSKWLYGTTADGGKTWTQLPIPAGLFTGGFHFFTHSFGRILVNNQVEWAWLETRDSGATWAQIYPPLAPLLTGTPTLHFQDADHGVAAHALLNPRAILTTADAGRTWQLAPEDGTASSMPSEGSPAWTPQTVPGKVVSSSLHPGGCGWVLTVGEPPTLDLSLLVTQDAGHTWTRIAMPGLLPTTVTSVDCTNAWLTDSRGHLYRTANGGHEWDQVL